MFETCGKEYKYEGNNNMEDLYFECVNILTLVMSLNSSRFHIPGETVDRVKLRQKAIDAGVQIVVIFILKNTLN